MFERLSIELTNQCSKGCPFCYNGSKVGGETLWLPEEVIVFVQDCSKHGVKAVSFGGGEPLEYPRVFDVLERLQGVVFRSVTTNGLLLEGELFERLIVAQPDKVHVSLHFPHSNLELARVTRQVRSLEEAGIPSGVNLLVARSQLDAARRAASRLSLAGLSPQQIVYLPMRVRDTPAPSELGSVAATTKFQSMSCLTSCRRSIRFCSIGWDKSVAWCSYTTSRRRLAELSYEGLCSAMSGLGLQPCDSSLVQLEDVNPEPEIEDVEVYPHEESEFVGAVADYPAAHSMDTEWFATDQDGYVALFDTGEPGLMPNVLSDTHGLEYCTIVDDVLLSSEPSVRYDLDDFFNLGPGTVLREVDFRGPRDTSLTPRIATIAEVTQIEDSEAGIKTPGFFSRVIEWGKGKPQRERRTWHELHVDAICWLRDAAILQQLPQTARLLHTGEHLAAWVPDCPAKLLRQLYDENKVLGVMIERFYPPAHRFGFYVYECDDYNEGPYDRVAVPRRPVKLSELPEAARFASQRVQFDAIRFAQIEKLQPVDYLPCYGWGTSWMPGEK